MNCFRELEIPKIAIDIELVVGKGRNQ